MLCYVNNKDNFFTHSVIFQVSLPPLTHTPNTYRLGRIETQILSIGIPVIIIRNTGTLKMYKIGMALHRCEINQSCIKQPVNFTKMYTFGLSLITLIKYIITE